MDVPKWVRALAKVGRTYPTAHEITVQFQSDGISEFEIRQVVGQVPQMLYDLEAGEWQFMVNPDGKCQLQRSNLLQTTRAKPLPEKEAAQVDKNLRNWSAPWEGVSIALTISFFPPIKEDDPAPLLSKL